MNRAASITQRLLATASPGGAWGYRPDSVGASEPTALASIALSTSGGHASELQRARKWLGEVQNPDGGIPVSPDVTEPCWPTALAILAWLDGPRSPAAAQAAAADKAVRWLLATFGRSLPEMPNIFGHDTTLQGWPWGGAQTHSWAEPTAYAVMALRASGVASPNHPRISEAATLLLDRTLPEGGWNYGNTRVLGNTLRAFPATTGIVLTALASCFSRPTGPLGAASIDGDLVDKADHERIQRSTAYLVSTLPRIRAPHSLAWGLIGLTAWNARPEEADEWLDQSAARYAERPVNPLHDALWLLASARWRPYVAAASS